MKRYTAAELKVILDKHSQWLADNEEGERADLSYADLRSADLSYADLRSAYLSSATGNMREIKSLHCDIWNVVYTSTHMHIGCESHEISTWWAFEDADISSMDSRALTWWAIWKPILKNIIEVSPATTSLTIETKGEQA